MRARPPRCCPDPAATLGVRDRIPSTVRDRPPGRGPLLPADPPRLGAFALWQPPPQGIGTAATVGVVQPDAGGLRTRPVPERLLPVVDAVPWLAALPEDARVAPSQLAWAAAVKAVVALLAHGRLRPGVSPRGFGAWYVGPLDSADGAWLDRLAATFPALAHALPLPDDPSRLRSPRHLIAACWDAVADVLVRTAAAVRVCTEPGLSSPVPVSAEHLRTG